MIAFALVLFGVGVADLVAGGLGGWPPDRRRALLGCVVGSALATLGAALLGPLDHHVPVVAVLVTLGTGCWLLTRLAAPLPTSRAWLSLATLAATLAASLLLANCYHSAPTAVDAWVRGHPLEAISTAGFERLLLALAACVFSAGTANGIVRVALAAAGTRTRSSQERLRGGRMIGVLERWLILGLMLHGEPTAAALVASAKSILRFPELSRVARQTDEQPNKADRVDHVTEYFLLGSLVSWLVAIALALLVG